MSVPCRGNLALQKWEITHLALCLHFLSKTAVLIFSQPSLCSTTTCCRVLLPEGLCHHCPLQDCSFPDLPGAASLFHLELSSKSALQKAIAAPSNKAPRGHRLCYILSLPQILHFCLFYVNSNHVSCTIKGFYCHIHIYIPTI